MLLYACDLAALMAAFEVQIQAARHRLIGVLFV